ncbi:hypothetical protein G7046_g6344 [Stylonectria norvegica]|nr:hypothetical protein G7046_g6344 [Stylonectria norvegica]
MARHFGMIAGGTGITPMLQIIRAVLAGRTNGDKTEIDLIFANSTHQDILLKENLLDLAQFDTGFRVHFVLSKPPEGWTGINYLPKPADDVKVLLCGPSSMISAMKKATESIGFRRAMPVSKPDDQVFVF